MSIDGENALGERERGRERADERKKGKLTLLSLYEFAPGSLSTSLSSLLISGWLRERERKRRANRLQPFHSETLFNKAKSMYEGQL